MLTGWYVNKDRLVKQIQSLNNLGQKNNAAISSTYSYALGKSGNPQTHPRNFPN